jgi:hypothetical protein
MSACVLEYIRRGIFFCFSTENGFGEVVLEKGFVARLALLTLATQKAHRAFGAMEERWCDVLLQLRVTHTYLHGAPWVVECWLLKDDTSFSFDVESNKHTELTKTKNKDTRLFFAG